MNISPKHQTGVLLYRVGTLGDSLVTVPALWVIRDLYPHSKFTLLTKEDIAHSPVMLNDLFEGTEMFSDVLMYPTERAGRLGRLRWAMAAVGLIRKLRKRRFDVVFYLAQTIRSVRQQKRDLFFFRLAGIKTVYGADFVPPPMQRKNGEPLIHVPSEAQRQLDRLLASGIEVPALQDARRDIDLRDADFARVDAWEASLSQASDGPWLAVAPGSNMPSKLWPEERFRLLVDRLIKAFGVWPVVFGGPQDKAIGERLVASWGRGSVAAGALSPRSAAAALQRCEIYVGHDTGTMHLAAAAGIPCVALFSARDWPGSWDPIGSEHSIIRKPVPCEGCRLTECDRGNECMLMISVDEVYRVLEERFQIVSERSISE